MHIVITVCVVPLDIRSYMLNTIGLRHCDSSVMYLFVIYCLFVLCEFPSHNNFIRYNVYRKVCSKVLKLLLLCSLNCLISGFLDFSIHFSSIVSLSRRFIDYHFSTHGMLLVVWNQTVFFLTFTNSLLYENVYYSHSNTLNFRMNNVNQSPINILGFQILFVIVFSCIHFNCTFMFFVL